MSLFRKSTCFAATRHFTFKFSSAPKALENAGILCVWTAAEPCSRALIQSLLKFVAFWQGLNLYTTRMVGDDRIPPQKELHAVAA